MRPDRKIRSTRVLILVLSLSVLLSVALASTAFATAGCIDTSTASSGHILVSHPGEAYGRIKVIIQKGAQSYNYDVRPDDEPESLPLQMGSGDYLVKLMENTTGNFYQEISRVQVALDAQDENKVYLASIQNIDWQSAEKVTARAKKLVEGLETDGERILSIYRYIVRHFSYDWAKAKTVAPGYLPVLDEVLEARKGICYDLASLFAGMLRSVGIPAKLVTGYVGPERGYHAWNLVYDGDEWVKFDPTFAASGSLRRIEQENTVYEIRYQY